MRRHAILSATTSLVGAIFAALAVLPAVASAKIAVLGAAPEAVRGSCPGTPTDAESCQALTKTTGYQAKVGPDRTLYRAPADGRIVAWSVALGEPSSKQLEFFDERYGEGPRAAVVVLDPGKKLSRRVVAKAPMKRLASYLGQSVQFPLSKTLPIRKGQYVGITVPTWAPVMQIGMGVDTSWRSSRDASGCSDFTTQFAMLGRRRESTFRCLYKTARLTYSATFISTPTSTPDK